VFVNSVVLFLILIIAYNPWTLNLKSEIISDIPFTVIFIAIILLYRKFNNIYSYILVGLLCGYLLSVRTIGIVLPLAFFAKTARDTIVSFIRKEKHTDEILKQNLLKLSILLILCFGIYYLLNNVIFKIPPTAIDGYFIIFSFHDLYSIILQNLVNYTELFESFFNPKNGKINFLPLITRSFVCSMILVGFIKKVYKNFDFTDFIVILYIFILLIFPCICLRYLFPLLPFFMSYAVEGFKTINFDTSTFRLTQCSAERVCKNSKTRLLSISESKHLCILQTCQDSVDIKIKTPLKAIILGSIVLIQYYAGINEIINNQNKKQEGPCTNESQAVFEYIKSQTPKDAVIAFIKPRALAFFADRKCISNNIVQMNLMLLKQKFDEAEVGYYLLYCKKKDELYSSNLESMLNPPLEKYIEESPEKISLMWSNERFKLYQKNN